MATLDHIILKVNDLNASVAFYTEVIGFALEGTDGPFTVITAGPEFQLESGARGVAPTLYFNDPTQHLIEIRTYEREYIENDQDPRS
jgi:predicted enzyme related to lactoylglutathione lyase